MSIDIFEIPNDLLEANVNKTYYCSARDYISLYESFRRFPLPDDILFPWLHGVDGRSNQQNLFFRVRRSLVPRYRGMILIHCDLHEHKQRLVESFLPLEILDNESHFLNKTSTETKINLRNFENQVRRMATLCDIFLYGEHAERLAPLIVRAQEEFYQERMEQIENVIRTAGQKAAANANRIQYKTIIIKDDFSVFEKEFPDYIMYNSTGLALKKTEFNELEEIEMRQMSATCEVTEYVYVGHSQEVPQYTTLEDNPNQISICIECHELGEMPTPSILTLARETLNELGEEEMPSEIVHFDMHGIGFSGEAKILYDRFISLLEFMRNQEKQKRRILIHCSDGYTESSVLVLIWIMYRLKLNLPQAYLYLQQKRSFFVYSADLTLLRKMECLMFGLDEEPEPKRRRSEPSDALENLKIGQSEEMVKVYQANLSPSKDEVSMHPWFYSPRFEGSFPSRILPFLYLGNLNHATNPEMLRALSITHVVSVGENADLQTKGFEILFLDNLYDDGIDAIRERLDQVVQFVDEARKKGESCLIHCRVGVSRSAAVTICYVMKYLKYSLVEAYLFVRARRLNVIIQPNLKFVYEMLQLEQKERGTLSISWPMLCKEIHGKSVY